MIIVGKKVCGVKNVINTKQKNIVIFILAMMQLFFFGSCAAEDSSNLDGFKYWLSGSDPKTIQLIPVVGNNALALVNSRVIAHVKFNVVQYGEMSFPINPQSSPDQEALKVDLSKSNFIVLTYKANHPVILQLRQAGVHGGVQNHIELPPTEKWATRKIYFSSFTGGLKPLDLSDVAKFNFAFLSNNKKDGFAELSVKSFRIDHFQPMRAE